MKTENLIDQLSRDFRPVKPIESALKRFVKWLFIATVCVITGISLLGLREDWKVVFQNPTLLLQNILILLGVLVSSATAIVLSVPGNERKLIVKTLAGIPFLIWTLLLILGNYNSSFEPGHGLSCVTEICIMGAAPGIFLFLFVRKGAVLLRGYVGWLVLLASAGLGAWAVQFTCHNDDPAHILFWHFLPILLLAFLGRSIGIAFLKRV